jgi:hypothetical protein
VISPLGSLSRFALFFFHLSPLLSFFLSGFHMNQSVPLLTFRLRTHHSAVVV